MNSRVPKMDKQALQDTFNALDRDGSGFLERAEVITLVRDMGKDMYALKLLSACVALPRAYAEMSQCLSCHCRARGLLIDLLRHLLMQRIVI